MKKIILRLCIGVSFIYNIYPSVNRLKKPAITAGAAFGAGAFAWYNQNNEQSNKVQYNPTVSLAQPQNNQKQQQSFVKNFKPTIEQSINQAVIKLLDLEEDANIEGKTFQDLTTQAQRVAFLQRDLKDAKVAEDLNFPLIAHYINNYDNMVYKIFITKLHEYANIYGAGVITMHCIDRSFGYIVMYAFNLITGYNFGFNTMSDIDMLIRAADCSNQINFRMNPALTREYAFHESAHALMLILRPVEANLIGLSTKGLGFIGAGISTSPQDLNNSVSKTEMQAVAKTQQKLAHAKNNIMMLFAGSIGQQIYHQEKLSLQAMLADKKYVGAGNKYIFGTDVYKAYQEAEFYCRFKNNSLVADEWEEDFEPFTLTEEQFDQEVWQFLEESYNQAWTILEPQKELLKKIANKALEDEVLSGDVMYNMAGVKRSKYEFEKTPLEKAGELLTQWVSWTLRRSAFYERHHPQV
ncbi:MAG: hypothetical protein ACXWL2_02450 [Candidatus Chromulinivorax sp.]